MPSLKFPLLVFCPLLFVASSSTNANPSKPSKHAKQTRPAKPSPAATQKKPPKKMKPTRHEAKASIVDHKPTLRPVDTDEPALLYTPPKKMKGVKAPPKKTMAQLLAEAGSPLVKAIFATTRLTVRRPWASEEAFLSFQGKVSVQPGLDREGSARIAGATVPRGSIPIDQTPGPSVNGVPIVDLGPQGKMVVTLTAQPGTSYVMSCNYASDRDDPAFGASVRDGAQRLSGGLTRRARRVIQVIPARAKQRVVQIELTAQYAWTTSGCAVSSGE